MVSVRMAGDMPVTARRTISGPGVAGGGGMAFGGFEAERALDLEFGEGMRLEGDWQDQRIRIVISCFQIITQGVGLKNWRRPRMSNRHR